jgi:hypothetical protein
MKKLALVALALCLPLGAAAQQKGQEPPDINFQFKVDQAIEKGIKYLKGKRTGSYHMEIKNGNELILLTYIHSGIVPEDDADFQALLKETLEDKLERTYKVALHAMCLEEIHRLKYRSRIQQCAQFLVDNLDDTGESRYGQPSIFVDDVPTTAPTRKDVASSAGPAAAAKKADGAVVDVHRKAKPVVKDTVQIKRQRPGPVGHDHSNMQYHALGLRACYDSGMRFEDKFIKLVDDHWRRTQIPDAGAKEEDILVDTLLANGPGGAKPAGGKPVAAGATSVMPVTMKAAPAGWGYQGGAAKSHGSMTVGAVGALCILDHMQGKDWRQDKDVLEGLQWMNKHFTVTENAEYENKTRWHYYYLYGIERVGMLFGTETIGSHKWYREGAEYLLAQQAGDGHWNDVVDTCFAILFLRRATRPLGVATGGRK